MKKILVIDDDETFRSTIKSILLQRGYEVLESAGTWKGPGPDGSSQAELILTALDPPAEEALRQSERRYRTLVDSQGEGLVMINADHRFTFANPAAGELFGLEPDQLVGRHLEEFLDSRYAEVIREQFRLRKIGKRSGYEVEVIAADGRHRHLLATGTPELDDQGRYCGSFAVFRDISERKKAEEQMRLQTSALEATSNGIVITDRSGRILWVNPAFTRLTGYTAAEVLGRTSALLKSGRQDESLYRELWRTILEGKVWHGEIFNRRKDGSHYPEEMTITPVLGSHGEISHFIAVKQDISKRKQIEEALSRERDLLQALLDNLPDCLYFKDAESRFLRVSPALVRLFNRSSQEEVIGKTDMDFLPLNYARQALSDERRLFVTGEPIIDRLEELRQGDKTTWFSSTKVVIRNTVGEITGLVGVSRDITERRRADERLVRINDCFLRFGEDIRENILQMTRLAREFVNADCALYLQTDGAKLVGAVRKSANAQPVQQLPAHFLKDTLLAAGAGLFLARGLHTGPHAPELAECGLADIQTWVGLPVRLGKTPVGCLSLLYAGDFTLTPADERVLGVITAAIRVEEDRWKAQRERNAMEAQLRQAQKLEAVGQLAAGIAHEINTPTQYVGDNTRFLQDSFKNIQKVLTVHQELLDAASNNTLTPDLIARARETAAAADLDYLFEQVPAAINETLEGVGRITRIVRAMKEFSHPGGKERAMADINRAIESTVTVARNEWKYVAEMKLELDAALPPVPCFLGEFNQAILNLVINAAHAVSDVVKQHPDTKGVITVRTRQDGNMAEVRVSDTGAGIPEAVRPHIFEPFFTTKPVGKGTGQGLSLVYASIVKQHGGTVRFESEPGRGATFIVQLPIVCI